MSPNSREIFDRETGFLNSRMTRESLDDGDLEKRK